ncbi:MAG: phosphatidate cytidylyltransferase, partial [Clostridia bacterium]|nr:phosphatidate cytidylyltransferase [Clostridia bacterium]
MSETKTKKKLFKGERTASTIVICVCLVAFLLLVIFDITPVITAVLAALAATATFEITRAVGTKSKLLFTVACTASLFTVLAEGFSIPIPGGSVLLCIYALLLMCLMVFRNKEIQFTHCAAAFFSSVALPFAFLCFLRLNNIADWFSGYTHHEGVYFVGLGFACSWFTDTFAYLVGRKFG